MPANNVTIYHNPRCTKSRETLQLLRDEGIEPKVIEYLRPGITQLGDASVIYNMEDNWRFEVAAYRIDRLIGLGLVPATIEREYRGRAGSLQWWVES